MTASQITNTRSLSEPRLHYINKRKLSNRNKGPYSPKTDQEVDSALKRLFKHQGFEGVVIEQLSRMTGGASKEQFAFNLKHNDNPNFTRYVLRMDPLEGIVETCRLREGELLKALYGVLPVPPVFAIDEEGEHLGLPGLITEFVEGVTKPTQMEGQSVSGIGSNFGHYIDLLAPQFLNYLVSMHTWQDWDSHHLPNFTIPAPNSKEAALYQVNAWTQVWEHDIVEPIPLITITENWLRENAPLCQTPCLVHCDYRIGNFMFEEPSGNITAILDWELAHFGDFHEDLAWILQKLFGTWNDQGDFLVCGLMPREEFIDAYQQASGRTVEPNTLRYYEIMNAWKCAIMDLSSAIIAGQNSNNHQDLLITWLGSAGAVFLDQIEKLMREY